MHKCDRCKYKGEHQEMGFRPVGVCLMEHNLVKAVLAYDAPKCPFLKEDIHISPKLGKLQSTISQLSKALCGKENSTLDEILQAANQVKSRLAQVERERDALICNHIPQTCDTCKYSLCFSFDNPCNTCNHLYRFNAVERGDTDRWEFVGVCAENTEEG